MLVRRLVFKVLWIHTDAHHGSILRLTEERRRHVEWLRHANFQSQDYSSEVQMLAKELVKFRMYVFLFRTHTHTHTYVMIESQAGITSLTDDGVDLKHNDIEEIQWMRENTPELFPWVNQCGDGSEWLARAGTPYAVPELYSVKGPTGNASSMASSLLGTFDDWSSKSRRYDLKFWPLINVGDGGDTGFVRSKSLVRFSAYSSLAFNAKGLNWYCWGRGIYNLTSDEPSEIYDEVKHVTKFCLGLTQS